MKLLIFAGCIAIGSLANGWFALLLFGDLHHWWPMIPMMGFRTAFWIGLLIGLLTNLSPEIAEE